MNTLCRYLLFVMAPCLAMGLFQSCVMPADFDVGINRVENKRERLEQNLSKEIEKFSGIAELVMIVEKTELSREGVSRLKNRLLNHEVTKLPDVSCLLTNSIGNAIQSLLAEISVEGNKFYWQEKMLNGTSLFEIASLLTGKSSALTLGKHLSLADVTGHAENELEMQFIKARLVQAKQEILTAIETNYSDFISTRASLNQIIVNLEGLACQIERVLIGLREGLAEQEFSIERLSNLKQDIESKRAQLISALSRLATLKAKMNQISGLEQHVKQEKE